MEAIRGYTKNPIAMGVFGLVIGAIFGLIILGWWLWPVKWVDAGPQHLNETEKVSYLRQSVEAFGYNGDSEKARSRYAALGDDAANVLTEITLNPGDINPDIIVAFSGAVLGPAPAADIANPPVPPAEGAIETQVVPAAPVVEEEEGGISIWLVLLFILIGLAVIAALGYYFFLRGRWEAPAREPSAAMQAEEARQQAAWTDYSAAGNEPPIAQFMASYHLGDDLFDDSFSIDSASGEFLGECGVGISETIGVGDPKKVTAFEVWLFDKNDIQTVTKVLMSEHAFHDLVTRQRLEAKGEATLAQEGGEIVLDTQTLQLVTRVVNMEYGDGAMPDNSYFKTFLIELAIWQKAEA